MIHVRQNKLSKAIKIYSLVEIQEDKTKIIDGEKTYV